MSETTRQWIATGTAGLLFLTVVIVITWAFIEAIRQQREAAHEDKHNA